MKIAFSIPGLNWKPALFQVTLTLFFMNLIRSGFLTSKIITVLIWSVYCGSVYAQESGSAATSAMTGYPQVEWIKSWPSKESSQHSRSFKEYLNSIFFGIQRPELLNPVAVLAENPAGFMILDQGNQTMFQVDDEVGDIPQSVLKSDFPMSSLVGLCYGPDSSILFTDSKSGSIYKIVRGKKKLRLLNDTLKLDQPTGIAFDPVRKEIFVIETRSHRICVLNENGALIRRIGIRGNGTGEFNYPTHLWISKQGNIYVTDAMNFRIQVLDHEGRVISVFGEAGDATGYLARPKGIATDSSGNIYIVDALFHAIQVFNIKGVFLYSFGKQGHGNGEFWMPSGICIDDHDFIYVADTYNSRIQVFHLIRKEKE